MSGNQYVYSLEVRDRGTREGQLLTVKKSRRQIRDCAARAIQKYLSKYEVAHSDVIKDLTSLHHYAGDGHICDFWLLTPKKIYRPDPDPEDLHDVEFSIRCWVIKKAKPKGPVRGTLRTKWSPQGPAHMAQT